MEVDLDGVVASDKSRTTAYLAIVEAVVNSLQSIKDSGRKDGEITVNLIRSNQIPLDIGENALLHIVSVHITDNGVGFTKENRESFGTLFSTYKKEIGGKGYGRIAFLKHFDDVSIDSVFEEDGKFFRRKFTFQQGMNNDNLENEITPADDSQRLTVVKLSRIKNEKGLDKKVETVSRKILEMLLPYFVDTSFKLPKIIVKSDTKTEILNDLVNNSNEIIEIGNGTFSLEDEDESHDFSVVICKVFYSSQSNRISLVAHNREVIETNLSEFINEFSEPFVEDNKMYVIKAYVMSKFLDDTVKHQRTGFNFGKSTPTLESKITQDQIDRETCEIVKNTPSLADKIQTRTQVKIKKVQDFVDENPWHKSNMDDLDYGEIPLNPSDQDIEVALHKLQYDKEVDTKQKLHQVIEKSSSVSQSEIDTLVVSLTEINKDQLARYVAHRKLVIDLLKKSLAVKDDGKYETEDTVHSLIYPTNSDSKECNWNEHNLWLLDERLTFTQYVTSDQKHVQESKDRSDILVFDKSLVYRSGEDAGNPVTIFELKRPQRFDYLQQGSKEDPVEQILRYCQQIKTNTLRDESGRTIKVHENTPFYGYIISDINGKVEEWLRLKDFRIMPDGNGWYYWHSSLNLYVEFMGWDKIWKDAEMRNRIFFNQLGIK